VERSGGQSSVTGQVIFALAGQDDQTYLWVMETLQVDGQWLLSAVVAPRFPAIGGAVRFAFVGLFQP